MTPWRDGMGRLTVRTETGNARRGELVMREGQPRGLCRMPGWLQIYGPASIRVTGITEDHLWQQRQILAARARRQRLPSAMRYERARDPRFQSEGNGSA